MITDGARDPEIWRFATPSTAMVGRPPTRMVSDLRKHHRAVSLSTVRHRDAQRRGAGTGPGLRDREPGVAEPLEMYAMCAHLTNLVRILHSTSPPCKPLYNVCAPARRRLHDFAWLRLA